MNKIIDKAIKGGYEPISKDSSMYGTEWTISNNSIKTLIGIIPLDTIIFSHDFLKAFFGEELIYIDDEGQLIDEWEEWMGRAPGYCIRTSWQYHAQQLVLLTDRKEYLERFL